MTDLTILMPCLNEARTLERCIVKARGFLERSGTRGEIVIADNGSTDGSQELARRLGARVIDVPERGYGAALIAGIDVAQGRWVIMGDSDDSYDFAHLDGFVQALRVGYQLVMGNRFRGGIASGAMPALHRYLGNPVLSTMGRIFFRTPVRDFHCGLRGFEREAIRGLQLRCLGMEFASEMVVKASLHGLRITEVPTTLFPDGRDRPPHLRSWRDGWRHLRFLLLFSPRWLFYYPGFALLMLGAAVQLALLPGPLRVGALTFDIHTMLYGAAAAIMGLQLVIFAGLAKVYAEEHGILPRNALIARLRRRFTLELGLVLGLVLMLAGIGLSVYSVATWDAARFGPLDPREGMRLVIPSMCLGVAGLQLLSASFFLGVLDLRIHAPNAR